MVYLLTLSGCAVNSATIENKKVKQNIQTTNKKPPFSLDTSAEGTLIEMRSGVVANFQSLTLGLIKIEDSRCPIGETCIWAGQILVTLEVTDQQNQPVIITLKRKRRAETVLTFGYSFRLLNVEPHPRKDKKRQFIEQTVQIEVVKQE